MRRERIKTMSDYHYNPDYIHHRNPALRSTLRELVFGIEDGMVSTMGAVTGIATGTGNQTIVVISGLVIIAVESISMAVGSYLSNKSEAEMNQRIMSEEKQEIHDEPREEKEEMRRLFMADGWPEELAVSMAERTGRDKKLMLKEMAYRELRIIPDAPGSPLKQGFTMLFSYLAGGIIPLAPFLFFNIQSALLISVSTTLIGLFALGAFTTRYSRRSWWKAGLEMLVLAGAAAGVGYFVGRLGENLLMK